MESFKADGAKDDIAKIRFQHFEEKRKRKIRLIEDTIRTGVLASLKETFPEALHKQGKRTDPKALSMSNMQSPRRNVSYRYSRNLTNQDFSYLAFSLPYDSPVYSTS